MTVVNMDNTGVKQPVNRGKELVALRTFFGVGITEFRDFWVACSEQEKDQFCSYVREHNLVQD